MSPRVKALRLPRGWWMEGKPFTLRQKVPKEKWFLILSLITIILQFRDGVLQKTEATPAGVSYRTEHIAESFLE